MVVACHWSSHTSRQEPKSGVQWVAKSNAACIASTDLVSASVLACSASRTYYRHHGVDRIRRPRHTYPMVYKIDASTH